jgi:hypothetical protein
MRGPGGRAAIAVLLLGACSTTHPIRPGPRIGLAIHRGGAWYVKDGREFAIGPLGGELRALVAASPEAAALAQRSHTELAVGVPAYVVGVAAALAGVLLRKPLGWGVMGGGIAVGATGMVLMGAGFTNAVDAVNVFNDSVGR